MNNDVSNLRGRLAAARIKFDRLSAIKARTDEQVDALAKEIDMLTIEITASSIIRSAAQLYPNRRVSPAETTNEENLAPSKLLQRELARQMPGLRRQFFRLTDEQRETVELEYRRHALAAHKSDMDPDRMFLSELIGDIRSGIFYKDENESVEEYRRNHSRGQRPLAKASTASEEEEEW